MTLLAASILVETPGDVRSALAAAEASAPRGVRLVEWRVDHLVDEPQSIETLVRDAPAPCIVTARSDAEGGHFLGAEPDRAALYARLIDSDHPPRYLDVELSAIEAAPELWRPVLDRASARAASQDRATGIIVSVHDFDGRPSDLLQRVEAMANTPGVSVSKIAWQARSLRDNIEAFELLSTRQGPTIVQCMGPFGAMSRVLAPKFGGWVTYAAVDDEEATAPGQLTVDELIGQYRFNELGAATSVYGVIGWPVDHSLGPLIHNAGFDAVGDDGVYLPLPVAPEYEPFKATLGALLDDPRLGLRGASVTLPHKANLIRFIEERGGHVDPLAAHIGAANTLVVADDGALTCLNTDAPAAVETLARAMQIEPGALSMHRVAVLGAGGVARAVVGGLAAQGAHVAIFNRSVDRAVSLASMFDGTPVDADHEAAVTVGHPEDLARGVFDVIVNCTSIGMTGGPLPDATPLQQFVPEGVPLDERTTVFDTVYAPLDTPLLIEATSRGARVVTGLGMFLNQAALQFEHWTGQPAPRDVFSRSLLGQSP